MDPRSSLRGDTHSWRRCGIRNLAAHFFSATGGVNDDGALVVSFDEARLGQQLVNCTLSAGATATYACINGGGNHPKAANKESVNGPLSSPTLSGQTENGRVQAPGLPSVRSPARFRALRNRPSS